MSEINYTLAHRFSNNHMEALKKDKVCGCFYCLKIYSPSKIKRWIISDNACDEHGTAICPYCDIDSVIGESSGFPITKEFLTEMNKRWFWTSFTAVKTRFLYLKRVFFEVSDTTEFLMHGHNSACAIVGPKKVRGLHKIGFLCNCCPFFKATIARLSFEAEAVCNYWSKKCPIITQKTDFV